MGGDIVAACRRFAALEQIVGEERDVGADPGGRDLRRRTARWGLPGCCAVQEPPGVRRRTRRRRREACFDSTGRRVRPGEGQAPVTRRCQSAWPGQTEQAVDVLRPWDVDCLPPMPKHPDDQRLELLQGTLDMLILRTLQWGPQHGHGIGQAIRRQSDELLKVETGSLYPALHRLEKRGWLKSEWDVSEANQRASTTGSRQRASPAVARARPLVAARGRDRPHHESRARGRRVAMRPPERDLDEEIRGHLALSIKERIERGEDPRPLAWRPCGNSATSPPCGTRCGACGIAAAFDAAEALARDIRLRRPRPHARRWPGATVVVTLALGIGANAAIFSVVRGVLLRPLVNRDEDRLIYIRQRAPGVGTDNMTFSVPEIDDFKSRVRTPVRRLLDRRFRDDRPRWRAAHGESGGCRRLVLRGHGPASGARPPAERTRRRTQGGGAVLTYRFWTTSLAGRSQRDRPGHPARTAQRHRRRGSRASIPYPADTEIIANVVTSPHHLGATMTTSRTHRMTELFGRLAPGASLEAARAELTAVHAAMKRITPKPIPTGPTSSCR